MFTRRLIWRSGFLFWGWSWSQGRIEGDRFDLIGGIELGHGFLQGFEESGVGVEGAAPSSSARVSLDQDGFASNEQKAGVTRVPLDEWLIESLW